MKCISKLYFISLNILGTQKSHICYRISMVMLHLRTNNLLIIITIQILTPMTSHIIISGLFPLSSLRHLDHSDIRGVSTDSIKYSKWDKIHLPNFWVSLVWLGVMSLILSSLKSQRQDARSDLFLPWDNLRTIKSIFYWLNVNV